MIYQLYNCFYDVCDKNISTVYMYTLYSMPYTMELVVAVVVSRKSSSLQIRNLDSA